VSRGPANGTESATRVADVLMLFLKEPAHGVSAIAGRLNLSKSVVHRILQSLVARSLIDYDDSRRVYRLGPGIAALGTRALGNLDLRTTAMPVLRGLARVTGETVTLSALVGSSRVYLDQLPSLKEVRMTVEVGRPFPLHAGASSRAILAFAPPDLRAMVLNEALSALTSRTITSREKLEASLAETTRTGIAQSFGERQADAGSVASPLFGPRGEVVGAISVCGPVNRFDAGVIERFAPMVLEAAREISSLLGWDGHLSDGIPNPFADAARRRTT
jgi:IclR family acetate operon transcriptional repressor